MALKFFDIDPANLVLIYRRQAFAREHQILQTLVNRERCLQLRSAMSVYNLSVPGPTGGTLTVPCEYFAVDWIENQVDQFFESQDAFDALNKLHLLNEIMLAVEALHRHEVFHRDLKADNLRSYQDNLKRIVVAIDLGTAALYTSQPLQGAYGLPVGAGAYSPMEAFCHFAGEREIAPLADNFALGCLLFELFNFDYYFRAFAIRNPRYGVVIAAMEQLLRGASDIKEKLRLWKQHIGKHAAGLSIPLIDGPGSNVPPGIAAVLNAALQMLVAPDFSRRAKDISAPRRQIWAAIRSLKHEATYQKRLQLARDRRRRRVEKAQAREKKLLDKR